MIKNIINKLFRNNNKKAVLSYRSEEIFKKISVDDIAIDCGANIGNVTEKMAEKGATVYAFEPNPYAFNLLKEKFANHPNVHCYNQGVWDKEGEMPLYLHEHSDEDEIKWSTGSSLVSSKKNIRTDKFVLVKIIDIAQFIESLATPIKLLKLDVEGVEVEIINKLIDEKIYKKINHIVVETHENKMPELKEKTNLLRKRIKQEKINNIDLNWI